MKKCTHGYPFDPDLCQACKRKPVPPKKTPTHCKNGHPYEGNRRKKRNGSSCILCDRINDRERQAAYRRARGVPTREESLQRLVDDNRIRGAAKIEARLAKEAEARIDGWEDLFGPVPDPVPNAEWFDEVIVIRALNKQRTGRNPYPLEWAEIFARLPRSEAQVEDLAESTELSEGYVHILKGRYDG